MAKDAVRAVMDTRDDGDPRWDTPASPLRFLLVVLLITAITEIVVHVFSHAVLGPDLDGRISALVDATLLAAISAPLLWGLIVYPLRGAAEAELLRLETAVRSSGEAIFLTDRDGTIIFVNPEFTRLYGFRADEVVGRCTPRILKNGQTDPAHYANFWRAILQGDTIRGEFLNKTRDGRLIPVESSVSAIRDDRGAISGFVAIQRDISERKRSEEALRVSEEKYRGLVEHVLDGVYQMRPDGRFLSANPALVRMLGYESEDDLLALDFLRDALPDARDRTAFLAVQGRDEVTDLELKLRHRNGRRVVVLMSQRAVQGPECALKWFEGTFTDITERKQLESQLLQAQKMEVLGRLAGGVAHDFNNQLMAITGFGDVLLDELAEDDPRRQFVLEICGASERASKVTRQLLLFSRKQLAAPDIRDLSDVVRSLEKMLRRLIGEDVILETELAVDCLAHVDASQIEQVLLNLAVNARDAMPGGGRLCIVTRVPSDEDCVELEVSDTGDGMEPEVLEHIFEPFFTTKGPGEGSGLGLSTVYGIVQQASGRIEVDSAPGRGTRMRILLPRASEASVVRSAVNGSPGGSETILLVEDEKAVRHLVAMLLQRKGYRVMEAACGSEALRQLQAPHPVDLLLTDVIMPGMSGRELAEKARLHRPSLKVLFMSGYTDDALLRAGVQARDVVLLEKPFHSGTLARKVREVLEGSGRSWLPDT